MSANGHSPWYSDGLAFECASCGGCCGGFPGYVWVSDEEADAIAEFMEITREKFVASYCKSVGGRHTLREVDKWNCVMLDDGKCRIYDARPVQCRTFPFWTENLRSRAAWNAAARGCPGMDTDRLYTFEEIERLRCMRHD